MKRQLLILIILVSISNTFGQENKINVGIKIGANYTIPSYYDKWHVEFDSKLNTNFGLLINYTLTDKLLFRTELIYSIQNINYVTELPDSNQFNSKGVQKDTFINLPILAKYKLNDKFSVVIGPQIGIIVNNDKRFIIEKHQLSYNNPIDKFNFTGNIGFSFKISEKIDSELRYNFGITDTNGFKNSVLQLNLEFVII